MKVSSSRRDSYNSSTGSLNDKEDSLDFSRPVGLSGTGTYPQDDFFEYAPYADSAFDELPDMPASLKKGEDEYDRPTWRKWVSRVFWSIVIISMLAAIVVVYLYSYKFYRAMTEEPEVEQNNPATLVVNMASDDYSYSPDGCRQVWATKTWTHYWRCVQGNVKLNSIVYTGSLGDNPDVKPINPNLVPDVWKQFDPEFSDRVVAFGNTYNLVPLSNRENQYALVRGESVQGIFAKSSEDFTPEEFSTIVSPREKRLVAARTSSPNRDYDNLVGATFNPIEDCGDTYEECDNYYKAVKPTPQTVRKMGTVHIDTY